MKFLYLFSTCLMALSSPILCAQSVDGSYESELQLERHNEISTKHCRHRVFGSATFRVLDSVNWYQVVAPNFPDSVRLTENRNQGFKEGEIHLRPYGLTIHQEGSYSVSFTAILANPDAVNGHGSSLGNSIG